jgi:hypothetical protein
MLLVRHRHLANGEPAERNLDEAPTLKLDLGLEDLTPEFARNAGSLAER